MILPEEVRNQLKQIFEKNLDKEVEIILLTDKGKNPEPSEIGEGLLKELSEIDNRIKYETYDVNDQKGKEILEEYKLDLDKWGNRYGPIFFFKEKPGIIYYGLPAGEEFTPFIDDIIMVSKNEVDVSMKAAKKIAKIDIPMDIYIFVTPTCPYCPLMTSASHKFAFLNKNIRGIMIEATEFPEFADAFNVYAVPRNVIFSNEKKLLEWEGALPEATFAEYLEHALAHAKGEHHHE